jgi:hypothetical protein
MPAFKPELADQLKFLATVLDGLGIRTSIEDKTVLFTSGNREFKITIANENETHDDGQSPSIPPDYFFSAPGKIKWLIIDRLKMNQVVFARHCEFRKISRETAKKFLDEFHFLRYASAAFHYGLFHRDILLAVAAFSKGRKMKRLPAAKRSFELIRFCTKGGFTVSGGLSKLVLNFCREKNAGDVMTYVDRQWSGIRAFQKAGFVVAGETPPNYFLVSRNTFDRTPWDPLVEFDKRKFYLTSNAGNAKLVYTPRPV